MSPEKHLPQARMNMLMTNGNQNASTKEQEIPNRNLRMEKYKKQ
jgi:hypothetical protein